MNHTMPQISVAFGPAQLTWLRKQAKALGISMGDLIRRIIDEKREAK